jgi:hypothetical protein
MVVLIAAANYLVESLASLMTSSYRCICDIPIVDLQRRSIALDDPQHNWVFE